MSDTSGSNFSSSIFTRHLEELEELQSGASSFEETPAYSDDENKDGEPNMEWRRQLVEEASTRVKQAKARLLDASKIYEPGTLLFDPGEGKFGRVKSSEQGELVVEMVHGGERKYGIETSGKGARGKKVTKLSKASKPLAVAKAARAKATKAAGISDVNAYIKSNFKTMSNRELARQTGLSEHTIRRKLGEWSLKRVKR